MSHSARASAAAFSSSPPPFASSHPSLPSVCPHTSLKFSPPWPNTVPSRARRGGERGKKGPLLTQMSPFFFSLSLPSARPGGAVRTERRCSFLRPSFGLSSSDTHAADRGKEEERSMRDGERDRADAATSCASHSLAKLCQPSLLEPFSHLHLIIILSTLPVRDQPAAALQLVHVTVEHNATGGKS